jgi:hypothetical protein
MTARVVAGGRIVVGDAVIVDTPLARALPVV